MTTFKIKAITKDKNSYEETIEAEDRFSVYRDIRERGDHVVKIEEVGENNWLSLNFINEILQSISADEKVLLVRNLGAMLEAGLPISRALTVMGKQTKNRRLKSVLKAIIADVGRGETLSSSFAKFPNVFSQLLISMVKAGEESGKLSESLRVVATQMEKANTLRKKIRGALMYPGIVISAMVIIGIVMLIFVVPTLTQTFEELGTELPPTTQAVIAVSNFLATNTILSIALIVAFIALFIFGLRTPQGKKVLDFTMLRVPVIKGLVQETNSARTTRTLSSLLSSGVDMVRSITITREVLNNSFYAKVLNEAEEGVVKGDPLSQSFEKYPNLYPPLVSEMIAVGEETGRLSSLLQETAEFYEQSVEQQTKDLSTIIEPFLMLIIGAAVGFFAISMIAPIYSLSGAL